MSEPAITQLRKLAREAELQIIEKPGGHFMVVGGLVTVHWWPLSRRLTAYVDGAPNGRHHSTAKNVVNLATKGTP